MREYLVSAGQQPIFDLLCDTPVQPIDFYYFEKRDEKKLATCCFLSGFLLFWNLFTGNNSHLRKFGSRVRKSLRSPVLSNPEMSLKGRQG